MSLCKFDVVQSDGSFPRGFETLPFTPGFHQAAVRVGVEQVEETRAAVSQRDRRKADAAESVQIQEGIQLLLRQQAVAVTIGEVEQAGEQIGRLGLFVR